MFNTRNNNTNSAGTVLEQEDTFFNAPNGRLKVSDCM